METDNRILVHTCCAPCAVYVYDKLVQDGYKPTLYFYNPNIHPEEEYQKRLNELVEYSQKKNIELIIEKPDFKKWHQIVTGLEAEPERGKRCDLCFKIRLERTAQKVLELGYRNFTTVLSISPHKNHLIINKIGLEIANNEGLYFLEENFKKQNGFKISLDLSKKYNMFRQNYCGCIYSAR